MRRNQEEAYFLKIDRELIQQMHDSLYGTPSVKLNSSIAQVPEGLLRYLDQLLKLDEKWLADI